MELFAGVAVSDYPRAVGWFEALLGTAASFEAHDTESVWILAEHRSVYVVLRPEHAGHSLVTVLVDDLDELLAAAGGRGIEPEIVETYDNGVRKATFRDPDGNEIGFGGMPPET
jgi:catechol 2,3-dioxygenase-like lactoylglutathione lyase family enzyme